jgi:hypothetical protein
LTYLRNIASSLVCLAKTHTRPIGLSVKAQKSGWNGSLTLPLCRGEKRNTEPTDPLYSLLGGGGLDQTLVFSGTRFKCKKHKTGICPVKL